MLVGKLRDDAQNFPIKCQCSQGGDPCAFPRLTERTILKKKNHLSWVDTGCTAQKL